MKAELPGIGSSPETPLKETLVHIKFHEPSNRWKWYVIECDGGGTFFGLVVSAAAVVAGQFTLTELENLLFDDEQAGSRSIRRDVSFHPMTVAELAEKEPGIREFLLDQTPVVNIQ